jgi:GT2 family glycosyltransferase
MVSVIIPTLNGKRLLETSLPALMAALKPLKNAEVVVIDNGSNDETIAFLKKEYPAVTRIAFSRNRGFTGAVNAGIRKASQPHVLILNNDCILEADSITRLLDFLNTHPEYVATQPVICDTKGAIENIGFTVDLKVAKAHIVRDHESTYLHEKFRHFNRSSRFIYGLSATCLMIKRDVFLEIGLLDESFHSYLEDVEFSIRMAKKKYNYAPDLGTSVTHVHMATSSRMGSYKQQRDLINWIRIILKHYPLSMKLKYSVPLLVERLRNLNGLLKKLVR